MLVTEKDDPALYAKVQEKNLIRQYDLLTNCVEIGLKQGPTSFDKYTLWALNHVAVTQFFSDTSRPHRGLKPKRPQLLFWIRYGVSDPPRAYLADKLSPVVVNRKFTPEQAWLLHLVAR